MRSVILCALMALLCGCIPRYQERPWGGCIYRDGHAYVLQGTETIKTATLLTVDGTFKTFSFPVERQFSLLDRGASYKELGRFIHKAHNCTSSSYEFFPKSNTVVVLDDRDSRLQNLTFRKSFYVDGLFLGYGQNESRFCLVRNWNANRISEVDKLTGQSAKLTKASTDFVGDTWHVNLFLSKDGCRITRAETDYSKKTITISAWDLQKEAVLLEPHAVSHTNEFDDARVLLCQAEADSVLLVIADSNDFSPKGRQILIRTFTLGSFSVQQNIKVEFNGFSARAFKDGPNSVTILFNNSEDPFNDRHRWGLKRYDLTTGECIYTDAIEAPATKESSP